jgi:hypothetical protein
LESVADPDVAFFQVSGRGGAFTIDLVIHHLHVSAPALIVTIVDKDPTTITSEATAGAEHSFKRSNISFLFSLGFEKNHTSIVN